MSKLQVTYQECPYPGRISSLLPLVMEDVNQGGNFVNLIPFMNFLSLLVWFPYISGAYLLPSERNISNVSLLI